MDNPSSQLKPWEQQPGESAKRYAAFSLYCQLGVGRNLEKAYELYSRIRNSKGHKKSIERVSNFPYPGFWGKWAVEGYWESRCKAYDNYVLKTSFNTNSKEQQKLIIKHHQHRTKDAELIRRANRKALSISFSRLKKVEDVEKSLPNFLDNFDPQEVAKILRTYDLESLCKMIKNASEGLCNGNEEESKTLLIDKLINIYSLTLEHPTEIKQDNVIDLNNAKSKAS